MSRERLKLLFKQHCEPLNGAIALKVTHTWSATHLKPPVDIPDSPVLSATCLSVSPPQSPNTGWVTRPSPSSSPTSCPSSPSVPPLRAGRGARLDR